MQKKASYIRTLESKIIGNQYETPPSLQKHKVESHFDKKTFYKTTKENSISETRNPAEESALKAEQEFLEMQERTKKLKQERQKHVKQIIKEKMIIEKKAKFKEFIKLRNKNSFSKEKKEKYEEEIRKKIIEKKRSSNTNLNHNINNIYSNNQINYVDYAENLQNQIDNFENTEGNKELFYHTIRVDENGDLKTNMIINENENYNVDGNDQADFKHNLLFNPAKNDLFNTNSQNIKIKYEEADGYDFQQENNAKNDFLNGNFNMNIYNNNNKSSNDYNFYNGENFNKQANDFTEDSNNYIVESASPNFNNLYYPNNDSFNIFKENQELLNKQIILNNENIIIEENENDENLNDESNKDKNFMNHIMENAKENYQNSNVINIRDDMQQKIREKLKQKQKEYNKKNPFYKEKNESDENNNSSSKIRDFLANSKLTFGENLTQDIYNISSAHNQISSCNDINYSGVNSNYANIQGSLNLRNIKSNYADNYPKNKSFDSINLHLNMNNNNNHQYNNYNDFNKELNKNKDAKKVKDVDINKYLDRKVTKIKAFRKSGTFAENDIQDNNYDNTDGMESFNSNNTDNSYSNGDSNLIENGYRTYNIALENKKRELLNKKSLMSQTGRTNGWDNSTNINKMIKR